MKVISVLNQKGGSGKTTISTHLARALQLAGHSVLLVDSDPQGSARDWAAANENQSIPTVGIDRPTIERDLKQVARHDFVVIDGAPQASDLVLSAMKASDIVVIPVQPSPYDIWATSDLVDLVKQRIDVTDGKLKAVFLISRAISGTKLDNEIGTALDGYGLPVLMTKIHQRVAYPTSAGKGSTVMDSGASDAAAEILALRDELLSLLK